MIGHFIAGLILGFHLANERRRYKVTLSLAGRKSRSNPVIGYWKSSAMFFDEGMFLLDVWNEGRCWFLFILLPLLKKRAVLCYFYIYMIITGVFTGLWQAYLHNCHRRIYIIVTGVFTGLSQVYLHGYHRCIYKIVTGDTGSDLSIVYLLWAIH